MNQELHEVWLLIKATEKLDKGGDKNREVSATNLSYDKDCDYLSWVSDLDEKETPPVVEEG